MAKDKPAYRFLKEAEADFLEGLRFYAERDRAVARRFDQLIKRTVALIVDNPVRWPIAVAHHSRDPASWKDRR